MSITTKAIEAARRRIDRGEAASVVLRDARVPGLALAIGRKSERWRYDFKLPLPGGGWSAGKRLTLGDLDAVDLEAARSAAAAAKAQIAEGVDPAAAKAARRASNIEASASRTVGEAIARYVAEREADWTAETRSAFGGDLAMIRAELGDAPLALVQRPALVNFIDGFLAAQRAAGRSGVVRAGRIVQLLSAIWRAAGPGSRGRPGWCWPSVDAAVADRLPVLGSDRTVSRRRVLTEAEIRKLWPALRHGVPGVPVGPRPRLVLALSLVTGLRIGALTLTRVADLDLDPAPIVGARDSGPTIRIPALDGRKASARDRREGVDLVLPLAPLAVALFREALALGDGSPFAFPGNAGKPLAVNTVSKSWKLLAEGGATPTDTVAHDLRRSMRTHLSELAHGGSEEDEERLIGHAVGSAVQRTYDRGRRLARLRPLANAWGARLEAIVGGPGAAVHRLRRDA